MHQKSQTGLIITWYHCIENEKKWNITMLFSVISLQFRCSCLVPHEVSQNSTYFIDICIRIQLQIWMSKFSCLYVSCAPKLYQSQWRWKRYCQWRNRTQNRHCFFFTYLQTPNSKGVICMVNFTSSPNFMTTLSRSENSLLKYLFFIFLCTYAHTCAHTHTYICMQMVSTNPWFLVNQ